jgi:hypothetical protein
MKFRLASDIHTEMNAPEDMGQFVAKVLPQLPDDKNTVLIIACDLGSMHHPDRIAEFIDLVAPRFEQVLYVLGNHEYYFGDLNTTKDALLALIDHNRNLLVADDYESIMLQDHMVHMCTLWTDYDGENYTSMRDAAEGMNDYRLIRNGKYIARPDNMLTVHKMALAHLNNRVEPGDIVITHHLPSFKSVPEAYWGQRVNGAYATNLESFILDKKPAIWCHGHTHDAFDYKIGDTRILCNPHGYGNQYKKNGYNPNLVFEL